MAGRADGVVVGMVRVVCGGKGFTPTHILGRCKVRNGEGSMRVDQIAGRGEAKRTSLRTGFSSRVKAL